MNGILELLLGISLGVLVGTTCTAIFSPEINYIHELILECEKGLPRSSTCELYAKEKLNE